MNAVLKAWVSTNPLNLNETLLAMRAYAPLSSPLCHWHVLFDFEQPVERVASPSKSYAAASRAGMVDELVKVAGMSLNMALEAAANEPQPANRCSARRIAEQLVSISLSIDASLHPIGLQRGHTLS